ncbi:MAG: phosphonate ABC transporter, permease protein PhnE [Puniceicoccaceae bacterium]|nr:MAG: phosphonate ABC transporter, permease protein PhnE [Puniceicoccaceae bacterium]
MNPATTSPSPSWRKRTSKAVLLGWVAGLFFFALLVAAFRQISAGTEWIFVADAHRQAGDLIARMVPPRWSYLPSLVQSLLDTLHIATLGTFAAIFLGTPLAFLAAKNTSPHPLVRQAALLLIVSSRSINTLIWAILFVIIVGPGVLAGIFAITLRSVGFIGKLLYEAIEEIAPDPVEAMRAVGAPPPSVFVYGIFPQVFPAFIGISVFRWDINVRESTILGLVGAGGIGLQLDASVNALQWSQVSVILLLVLLMVIFSEWLSAKVRGFAI